jgi:serralysin
MAFSDPIASNPPSNPFIRGLLWGSQWEDTGSATTTRLSIYVAGTEGTAETFDFGGFAVAGLTSQAGIEAWVLALQLIAEVCNLSFEVADTAADADIILAEASAAEVGALGVAVPPGVDPGPSNTQQGAALVSYENYSSANGSSLKRGGYDFVTFIHELGHALGLKHAHDSIGNFLPFPGVTDGAQFGDLGDNRLNQGLYTMMSYNDGWQDRPGGPLDNTVVSDRGWIGGPMAFDIAALQHMYGANMTVRAGSDSYNLPSVNAAGTFYTCIWDTGGTDRISNNSNLNSIIDLRAATLLNAPGGGGFLSYVIGIDGGYTIANGAVIEIAIGGSATDRLTGNEVANTLVGNAGNDTISGLDGNDNIYGGIGADALNGGNGLDYARYDTAAAAVYARLDTNLGYSGDAQGDRFAAIEGLVGSAHDDTLVGGAAANTIFGQAGNDRIWGLAGNDTISGLDGNDNIYGGIGADALDGGNGLDYARYDTAAAAVYARLDTNLGYSGDAQGDRFAAIEGLVGSAHGDTLVGGAAANTIFGLAGNDRIWGLADNDALYGGLGIDRLEGGLGADRFVFDTALNVATNKDIIADYDLVNDRILLENTGAGLFNALAAGNLNVLAFLASATGLATTAAHRILYNTTTGDISYDADGSGAATAAIAFANVYGRPLLNAGDFLVY